MAEMCVGSGSLEAGLEEPAMERGATSYGPTDEASKKKAIRGRVQ